MIRGLYRFSAKLPWWVSAALGLGLFYFFLYYLPTQLTASETATWAPVFLVLGFGLLGIFLLGAGSNIAKRLKDRAIYRKQQSLKTIRRLHWFDFERLITEAFRQQGYTAERTSTGADGGVDIVLKMRGKTTLVQCKQYKSFKVGVTIVRELKGVVAVEGADSGIVVCSGRFTREAEEFAQKAGITLIGGDELVKLMQLDSGKMGRTTAAVAPTASCPRCGEALVQRTARRGSNAGKSFIGCSGFPKCRYTRPV